MKQMNEMMCLKRVLLTLACVLLVALPVQADINLGLSPFFGYRSLYSGHNGVDNIEMGLKFLYYPIEKVSVENRFQS